MSTFRDLVADADETIVIVARFLALLELFKEGAIAFDQPEALGGSRSGGRAATTGEVDVTTSSTSQRTTREPGDDDRD